MASKMALIRAAVLLSAIASLCKAAYISEPQNSNNSRLQVVHTQNTNILRKYEVFEITFDADNDGWTDEQEENRRTDPLDKLNFAKKR